MQAWQRRGLRERSHKGGSLLSMGSRAVGLITGHCQQRGLCPTAGTKREETLAVVGRCVAKCSQVGGVGRPEAVGRRVCGRLGGRAGPQSPRALPVQPRGRDVMGSSRTRLPEGMRLHRKGAPVCTRPLAGAAPGPEARRPSRLRCRIWLRGGSLEGKLAWGSLLASCASLSPAPKARKLRAAPHSLSLPAQRRWSGGCGRGRSEGAPPPPR